MCWPAVWVELRLGDGPSDGESCCGLREVFPPVTVGTLAARRWTKRCGLLGVQNVGVSSGGRP